MADNVVIKSFVWKASERIIVQGLGLIIQIVLARLLMPDDFACLAIISAIVNYLGLFVQSGLTVAVVQKRNLCDNDIATLTTISLSVAFLMYAVLFWAAPYIDNYYQVGDIAWPIRIMGLSLFLFAFNSIQTGLLQRKMMFRAIFKRSLLATPLSGFVGIVMAYKGLGIWSLIAYSISNILFIVLFMYMIPDIRLKLGFSLKSAKELYSFSTKIIGTSLVSAGGDTIRTLTIGKHYNASQLAYFDRGLNYSGLVTQVVNTSLSSVLLPVYSRSQDDNNQLLALTRRSVGLATFIMVPALSLVALLAEPLIIITLTEKWAPCALFFSLFCVLRIPGIITSCDKQVYYAIGNSKIGLYYETCLLVANIVSLFLMMPYGVLAIAIAFTVVEYIGNIALFFVSSIVFGYKLRDRIKDLAKPIINTIIMVTVLLSIKLVIHQTVALVMIQSTIGVLLYIALSIITKDSNFEYLVRKFIKNSAKL